MIKTLKDFDLKNKTILYRAPYDIEAENVNGTLKIKDTTRIDATLLTLEYLLSQNCKIAILTWVGRPDGKYSPELSTKTHAEYLAKMLRSKVNFVEDCVGEKVIHKLADLKNGEILMLENVRFHEEENTENPEFAKQLCQGFEFIVFDGFPQAHRDAPSTTGILKVLPACAGLYFEQEYTSLTGILNNAQKPFTLVIGGAKTSDKIDATNNLYDIADIILIGGGAANAFLKAEGKEMGNSYYETEKDSVQMAREVLNKTPNNNSFENFKVENEVTLKKVMLPYDLALGKDKEDNISIIAIVENQMAPVSSDLSALDLGPITQTVYKEIILQSKTVFWAGPVGAYENHVFSDGTKMVVQAICETSAYTIVAGGDTIDALNKFGDAKKIDHISLAGGATLDFLSNKILPVVELLKK